MKKGWDKERVLAAISAEGIPCFGGSCSEIYLEKAFEQIPAPNERLATAKSLDETGLMFLVHPTLTNNDMRDTCCAVEKVLNVASCSGSSWY
jgi:dTDP-4-amino-4,6-dideoxygalactose transaminase